MYKGQSICAVIPALDEAQSISLVVEELIALNTIDRIIVTDNGSTDNTAELARAAGAEVVFEPVKGYGTACQRALLEIDETGIVLFIDADHSSDARESTQMLEAIIAGADLVIGVRVPGWQLSGAMTVIQRFGNRIASIMIRLIWNQKVNDLGPFRAIRFDALKSLNMQDRAYGWTVEMQVKAIQAELTMVELPVHTRRRIGKSKICGTFSGVYGATTGIIGTILKLAIRPN